MKLLFLVICVISILTGCSSAANDVGTPKPNVTLSTSITNSKVNDTGITFCADANYNDLACNPIDHAGQDGVQGRDAFIPQDNDGIAGFQFTKLDNTGRPLTNQSQDYDANSWSCVRDEVTGLIWEVKSDNSTDLHYGASQYSWYSDDFTTNGGVAGKADDGTGSTCSWLGNCDTQKYVAAVNSEGLCGQSDWRLPTIYELQSIRNFGATTNDTASIDLAYFPNGVAGNYWTNQTASYSSASYASAYQINFGVGLAGSGKPTSVTKANKSNGSRLLRLVRAGYNIAPTSAQLRCSSVVPQTAPASRFTDNGDGTVTDAMTELVWKKCNEGGVYDGSTCNLGRTQYLSFNSAAQAAEESTFAGYFNWRVPNVKELSSIVEHACSNPTLNKTVFPSVNDDHWTSSPNLQSDPINATTPINVGRMYYIHLQDGAEYPLGRLEYPSESHFLLLVRNAE